jgi:hypothetical protein
MSARKSKGTAAPGEGRRRRRMNLNLENTKADPLRAECIEQQQGGSDAS